MLKIHKAPEPSFFSDFKKKEAPKNWDAFSPIAQQLREYILTNEQTIGDETLCVYCEKKVSQVTSHIDHVRPKGGGKFPKLFDKYQNLTVSCQSKGHCGHAKGGSYDAKFINPIEENPGDFMTYEISTGKIVPVASSKHDRVKRTCDILKLNSCRELLNARKRVLIELSRTKDKGASFIDYYPEFPTLIEFYRRECLT